MNPRFMQGHAAHPDGHQAMAQVVQQLRAQIEQTPSFQPTLSFIYLSDHHAAMAEALLADLHAAWPGLAVVGGVGVGVAANGVEYFDEPGLVMMLCDLAPSKFSVFNGRTPLARDDAWAALVHADPQTHDLAELIHELSHRLQSRYLFGGLVSARTRTLTLANGVFEGGLSGVAFQQDVALISRVSQGCQPLGPSRQITRCERNLVIELDGAPALPLLLGELGVELAQTQRAMAALRATMVGLTDAGDAALARGGQFGTDTRVRHLIGLDPARQAIAVSEQLIPGMQLGFCTRHVEAARRDLVRICTELREEVEAGATAFAGLDAPEPERRRLAGAIYVSCAGRGGPHFGAASAELQIVQRALGDVPLVGFFAAGEIARHHLYGYTGVLTVFLA